MSTSGCADEYTSGMSLLVTDAIVLHAMDYLESSRILRIATRDAGVVSVVARGARSSRKRFGSAIDLFAEGQVQMQTKPGRDMHTLVAFDVTRARPQLAEELSRFTAASALIECVIRVVQDEAAPRVFEDLAASLDMIAAAAPDETTTVTLGALWRLVAEVGFTPVLDRCAECHRPIDSAADATFSHAAGGTLCDTCAVPTARGRRLPMRARHAVLRWLAGGAVALTDADERAHQRLLREFLIRHLMDGRELKAFLMWELGGMVSS